MRWRRSQRGPGGLVGLALSLREALRAHGYPDAAPRPRPRRPRAGT